MKITELVGRARCLSLLGLAVFALSSCGGGAASSSNNLNVGYGVKAPDSVDLTSKFNGLMNYNGKTVEQLMAMRKKSVGQFPDLVQGEYKPSPSVFQIANATPWWGLKGYVFRTSISNNTDGASRESPYFGNPYMLVAPEWYGTNLSWSSSRFATAQSFADVFPVFLQPVSIKIFPKQKREEITYDVMSYYNNVKSLLNNNWGISDIAFDLNAYNAEDFGYNYLYVEPAGCDNLAKLPPDVIEIAQVLMVKHRDTCGAACNDLDSAEILKGFKLKGLPAKCRLLLWRSKPTSHLVPTDFTIDFVFKG